MTRAETQGPRETQKQTNIAEKRRLRSPESLTESRGKQGYVWLTGNPKRALERERAEQRLFCCPVAKGQWGGLTWEAWPGRA